MSFTHFGIHFTAYFLYFCIYAMDAHAVPAVCLEVCFLWIHLYVLSIYLQYSIGKKSSILSLHTRGLVEPTYEISFSSSFLLIHFSCSAQLAIESKPSCFVLICSVILWSRLHISSVYSHCHGYPNQLVIFVFMLLSPHLVPALWKASHGR